MSGLSKYITLKSLFEYETDVLHCMMSKTPNKFAPAFPVWYVFSSFHWAGWSTAIARLLVYNLTSIIHALVVFVQSALPYCSRDPTTQFFTKSL